VTQDESAAPAADFNHALTLHQQGKLRDAEAVYQAVLRQQPTLAAAWHCLGVIALQTGQPERAVELIGKSLDLNPNDPEAHSNHGNALRGLRRHADAIASYDKAIALRPDLASAWFNRGNALRDLKQYEAAAASYDAAIAMLPDFADAYFNRGNALQNLARFEAAIASYDRVIALRPNAAEAYGNRGNALVTLERYEAAIASYDRAIALKPDFSEAHFNRGNAMREQRDHAAAIASYDRAIATKPDYVEAFSNRGNALMDLECYEAAVESYDQAIELQPDFAEVHFNRGNALLALRRHAEADASYASAIALQPDYAAAHVNRGNALKDLKRYDEAIASYDRAIALRPDLADTHFNRGNALQDQRRFEAAVASYDQAIALRPDHATAYGERGNALAALMRLEDALASYDQAIALRPELAQVHGNRGLTLHNLRRHEDAIASYRKAIELCPDLAEAHWNLSLSHLAAGNYEPGWELFEWRWKAGLARAGRGLPGAAWLGDSPIAGKTILVHAEQGYGDTLQFCRYVPMLAESARVVLDVPSRLVRLLSGLPGVAGIVASGDALPPFDAWIPMLSLPLVFRTTLATIPVAIPYLYADPERSAFWRRRLAAFPGRKVGLVWAGSPRHGDPASNAIDQRRSITPRHYAPLGAIPGLCLISLQKGDAAARTSEGITLHDWTEELDDFADTAALVEALDLVISVDTAVAHLAGALAKPVWVLNRFDQCWRWLRDRDDSPWYPTARLFRQRSQGDWAGVMRDVVEALRVWV
jgi:tetratricopeptide (TPR) repeat protein